MNTHSPVPVVRAIIVDPKKRVLLLRRDNTGYASGQWCLPGGKIDHGQTAEAAVIREVLEETALTVVKQTFLFYQDSLPQTPDGMHCLNLYFACAVEGTLKLNSESSECLWANREELAGLPIAFRNGEALADYWSHPQGAGGADACT
ncbi:NUDIX hydrolase [Fundidesulfovibrio butyratiphilus]